MMLGSFGGPELLILVFLVLGGVLVAIPSAMICRKAGFSPWLGILAMVPILNVLLLWFLALAHWPNGAHRT